MAMFATILDLVGVLKMVQSVARQLRLGLHLTLLLSANSVLSQDVDIAASVLQRAHAKVTHDLKDPSSAQFRGESVREKTSTKDGSKYYVVCGEINAKNSYGAYVGFVPYYFVSGADVGHIRSGDYVSVFDIVWNELCGSP